MKYDILYVDPPWTFVTYSAKGKDRSPEKYYNTLSMADIKALPISQIASENSVLFLWTTSPHLQMAFDVLNSWGFTYKCIAFTWVKTCKKQTNTLFTGLGYYTRANAEFCILATKGNPLPRVSKAVHQVVMTPVSKHSEKPLEVAKRIVDLFGDRKRVEIFSRKQQPGWDAIGDEIDGRDIRDVLPEIIQKFKDEEEQIAPLTSP